jgi:hypothetical protein
MITEEYPQYVGTVYNDNFTVKLDLGAGGTVTLATGSVNNTPLSPISGITLSDTTRTQPLGTSGWQTSSVDITGAQLAAATKAELVITDAGDAVLDTVLLFDNIRVYAAYGCDRAQRRLTAAQAADLLTDAVSLGLSGTPLQQARQDPCRVDHRLMTLPSSDIDMSVGFLTPGCSAFAVAPKLIATAAHCLFEGVPPATSREAWIEVIYKVRYTPGGPGSGAATCDVVRQFIPKVGAGEGDPDGYDYGVAEVDCDLSSYGIKTLKVGPPQVNSFVRNVGHPAGPNPVQQDSYGFVTGIYQGETPGGTLDLAGGMLDVSANGLKGMSGSPILDRNGQVIAIHTREPLSKGRSGGVLVTCTVKRFLLKNPSAC